MVSIGSFSCFLSYCRSTGLCCTFTLLVYIYELTVFKNNDVCIVRRHSQNILQWNKNKTKSTKMTQWRLLCTKVIIGFPGNWNFQHPYYECPIHERLNLGQEMQSLILKWLFLQLLSGSIWKFVLLYINLQLRLRRHSIWLGNLIYHVHYNKLFAIIVQTFHSFVIQRMTLHLPQYLSRSMPIV